MRICLVASEAVPLAKTGGLADVVGALTFHLTRAGHDARLILPFYSGIEAPAGGLAPVEQVQEVELEMGARVLRFSLLRWAGEDDRQTIYLLDCPELYHRDSIYSADPDEPLRFAVLCRAALESCQRLEWSPQVFHCHDWHAALLPVYLAASGRSWPLLGASRTLLTLHNIAYQGVFEEKWLDSMGLGGGTGFPAEASYASGYVNLLAAGIATADLLSTVSPTYAEEIQTPELGMGLDGILQRRRRELFGILNGVDYDIWDPRVDPLIPFNYTPTDLSGKAKNKSALLSDLGLPLAPDLPLAGVVTRLVEQKGLDLLVDVLPRALEQKKLHLVALGSGEERYVRFLRSLELRFPQAARYRNGYDEELAHRIEAASDLFLMPSHFEPCGLNQMYSLRYGTPPLVRATGGLADSVQPFDAPTGSGTGFVFESFTPEAFSAVFDQALETWSNRATWHRLIANGMAKDFSWKTQVGEYEVLYRFLATTGALSM